MRLADFIETHMEAILADWEMFARTLLPASVSLPNRECQYVGHGSMFGV